MSGKPLSAHERILRLAHDFITETRDDLSRAAAADADLPPRIRLVHDRQGHASPEVRTLAVPIGDDAAGASPTLLSDAIARYARRDPPSCLMLSVDVLGTDENGSPQPLLIAEARERRGARLFMVQPFRIVKRKIEWGEPIDGGWRDPGAEEMIIDAAFERS